MSPLARAGALVALFFVALGGTALLVRRTLSAFSADELQEAGLTRYKLAYFDEHATDYEGIFVGSSRMYRQVAPDVFDAELAAAGLRTRSYNLGMVGMWFFEVLYRAQRFACRAPDTLHWMVIELQDPDPGQELENQRSKRTIAWHTPRITWIACRTAWGSDRPLFERISRAVGHVSLGLRNGLNAGFLTSAWEPDRIPSEFRTHRELRPTGYMPLDFDPQEVERFPEFQRTLAADPDFLRRRVERYHATPSVAPTAGLFADLAWLVGELGALGIEPIFVLLPPSMRARSEIVAAHERGVLPNLIDLEDPARFPEFYLDPALRFDANHLNRSGAEILTRRLARAVLPILAARRERP